MPQLQIALIPHPFGIRTREQVLQIAEECVGDIAKLLCEKPAAPADAKKQGGARAAEVTVDGDLEAFNRYLLEHHWSDGLPAIPPTRERVERMLKCTTRRPDEVVGAVAPAFGVATVERIAINAVMAGCYPEYLPVLIAATEAISDPRFNLRGIQATTNPAAVFMIVNGPIARQLGINSGGNCLGPGAWANATLGRAMRLIQQNIGGAQPGDMDKATQGQPGKYTFCCAENEAANPWEPLHVERGFSVDDSTVTVVPPLGTWNINTHAKDVGDLLRVMADVMAFPTGSDYVYGGGAPWLVLSAEHAFILKREGLSKLDVKKRLWELSRLSAARLSAKDFGRVVGDRRGELENLGPDSMLTVSVKPDDISVIGFDNSYGSDLVTPPLTTIAASLRALGTTAMTMVLDQIRDKKVGSLQIGRAHV